jgi:hypothetical protein
MGRAGLAQTERAGGVLVFDANTLLAYRTFFATATVCLIRGMFLWALHISNRVRQAEQQAASGIGLGTGGLDGSSPPVVAVPGGVASERIVPIEPEKEAVRT